MRFSSQIHHRSIPVFIVVLFVASALYSQQSTEKIKSLLRQGRYYLEDKEDGPNALPKLQEAFKLATASPDALQLQFEIGELLSDCYLKLDKLEEIWKLDNQLQQRAIPTIHDTITASLHYVRGISESTKNHSQEALQEINYYISIQKKYFNARNLARGFYMKGSIAHHSRDVSQAMDAMAESRRYSSLLNNERMINRIDGVIGILNIQLNNYSRGIELLQNALQKSIQHQWTEQQSMFFVRLGNLYQTLGSDEKAIEMAKHALELANKLQSPFLQIDALSILTTCNHNQKNYKTAESYAQQGITISLATTYPIRALYLYAMLIFIYGESECFTEAEQYVDSASKLANAQKDNYLPAFLLSAIANLKIRQGDEEAALRYYQRAYDLLVEGGYFNYTYEDQQNIGEIYLHRGNYTRARNELYPVISYLESIRSQISFDQETQTLFSEAFGRAYASLASAYAGLGVNDSAYMMLELSKGRSFDMKVSEDEFSALTIPDSLRHEIVTLQSDLVYLQAQYFATKGKQRDQLKEEIDEIEKERQTKIRDIHRRYPKFSLPNTFQKLPLHELQKKLKPNQVFIEFGFPRDQVLAIAVTSESIQTHVIRVDRDSLLEKILNHVEHFSGSAFNKAPRYDVHESHEIYTLLFKPFEHILAKKEQIILVPDYVFCTLPFEMLVTDISNCKNRFDYRNARYFVEDKVISYAVSASHWQANRSITPGREKGVFVIGNPNIETLNEYKNSPMYADLRTSRGGTTAAVRFLPLYFVESEASSLRSVFGASTTDVFLNKDATETAFKKFAVQYQVLHIAAHHQSNDVDPLKAHIFLANDGAQTNDGLLSVGEITKMKLMADLVVLSGCRTATSGTHSLGEGFPSIARAFQIAGVPSVIMTLFDIEDKSSSELMSLFYENLGKGLSRAEALTMAKRQMIRSGKKHPMFWAGFVLNGNDEPLHVRPIASIEYRYIILVVALLIVLPLLVYFRVKKRARSTAT